MTDPSTRYDQSRAAHARRCDVIAGGVNSNVRLQGTPVPLTFSRGDGALIWDVDGNEYVDYAAGMGPMILGHGHPAVTEAVQSALTTGQMFAGQNELEAEFAEQLVGMIPWVESIRIGSTGTEMDLLAVRIARAATGKQKVIRFVGHYHGWIDPLFINMGVDPEPMSPAPLLPGQSIASSSDLIICHWNDLDQVAAAFATGEVACVLMEPVMCNTGLIPPAPGYLQGVKDLCAANDALFIVDEVITGFRLGATGAQGVLGIHGDISIYAKAIASGFPLAVLGTTTELLAPVGRGEVNHSGTYNTGLTSVAAGVATLTTLSNAGTYPELDRISGRLAEGFRLANDEIGTNLAVDFLAGGILQTRFGEQRAMTSLADFRASNDAAMHTRLLELLQDAGIRPTGRGLWFISTAHDDEHVDRTVDAVRRALQQL